MSVQHKYRPKHLALAVALAVGCAEFTNAQELPEQAEPAGLTEATRQPDSVPDPFSRFQAFINADSTFKREIDSLQPARRGISVRPEDRDDLIIVKNGGSFEGRVDGGKGTNAIQLIGT